MGEQEVRRPAAYRTSAAELFFAILFGPTSLLPARPRLFHIQHPSPFLPIPKAYTILNL